MAATALADLSRRFAFVKCCFDENLVLVDRADLGSIAQVIHPAQIATVQAAFTPSREHVDWARQLVDAFERHQATGAGAFTFRGHMVDRPLLLQARLLFTFCFIFFFARLLFFNPHSL